MENIAANTQIHGHSLKKIITILLIGIFPIQGITQGTLSTQSKKARKLYEKANKKYKERSFYEALNLLEQSVVEDADFFEAYIRMGNLYKAIGQEDSVYSKYQHYLEKAPDSIASVIEKLAFMAFDRGEYPKSEKFLNQFLKKVPERKSHPAINLLERSLKFAQDQMVVNVKNSTEITPLPDEINQFRLQYLPSVTIDNATIFYTKRDYVQGDEDIVVSYYRNDQWTPAQSVSSRINSPLNEGACSVSADGRTMIFTSCDGKNAVGSCDLYSSKKSGEFWSEPKNLNKPVNSIHWESQPSLSADGQTLYFSSNRTGGYGGRDIWVSFNVDGKWSIPENLGSSVNTSGDETTPFIHPNGVSLYLSSNGYPGMGGYDLFVASKKDSIWSEPVNLGYPVNTHKDEVAIVVGADGETAYFAKEEQKNFEIQDSQLVTIKLSGKAKSKPVSYTIGRISDESTSDPLQADIEVHDLTSNEIIYHSKSDSITGEYYMVLPVGLDLAAYIKKEGYLYTDFHFQTGYHSILDPDTVDINLIPVSEGKTLILKNIYFETDSYVIAEKSGSEIDNVCQLIKENPGIIVEISGHTDNVGSHNYNRRLSEQRAQAVFDRLIAKGIDAERLTFKGYAETRPLMPNDTEFNRRSNRRIEFSILQTKQKH